ncbi:hypothetical protein [Gallaecimonas sp. GXIMD4217]|uniref:hypothetical protein n=1 Tax=Gallaecimonas sp. GXIMD4217 TaxID=3131927 RepID=UPI00311B04E8
MHRIEVESIQSDFCISKIFQAIQCQDIEAKVRVDRDRNELLIASSESRQCLVEALADCGYPAVN